MKRGRQTTVGLIDEDVLEYTAGSDCRNDLALIEWDCIGSVAHAVMLSEAPVRPRIFHRAELSRLRKALVDIIARGRQGTFRIVLRDQDVHMAVERHLTRALGEAGKKIHTARSRNDQAAVDIRLFARDALLSALTEAAGLAETLLDWSEGHVETPMPGRTHMQPAMPSSVALWASSYAEALNDHLAILRHTLELTDRCPLGAAAGYGVPFPIDRQRVSDLLAFRRPVHNVLYAGSSRGMIESWILASLAQLMGTLSRFAQDCILFGMPEFAYLRLPAELCTGSSIMPQKRNPDVMELVRARAVRVQAHADAAAGIVRSAPSGYNRDVQESKAPLLEGMEMTRATLRILRSTVGRIEVDRDALRRGFTPAVFATDEALDRVAKGTPFRDAYRDVKRDLEKLTSSDPAAAILRKTHLGGTAGLDLEALREPAREAANFAAGRRKEIESAFADLLRVSYPDLSP